MGEDGPGNASLFVGERDGRFVPEHALFEGLSPLALGIESSGSEAEFASGAMNEQCSEVDVAAFRDAPEPGFAAGGFLPGGEAEPDGELAAVLELGGVGDRGDEGGSGDGAEPGHLREAMRADVVAREGGPLAVVGQDPLVGVAETFEQKVELLPGEFG